MLRLNSNDQYRIADEGFDSAATGMATAGESKADHRQI
jgi:hypothetical protein